MATSEYRIRSLVRLGSCNPVFTVDLQADRLYGEGRKGDESAGFWGWTHSTKRVLGRKIEGLEEMIH